MLHASLQGKSIACYRQDWIPKGLNFLSVICFNLTISGPRLVVGFAPLRVGYWCDIFYFCILVGSYFPNRSLDNTSE